jgi:hypothetical protein
MPAIRLRTRLLDRVVRSASGVAEFGLALLMTAGVVHCGGAVDTPTGEGSPDAAPDHQLVVEAAIEAASFVDAGADASPYPMVEAPTPAPDTGSDAGPSPWIEAPAPPQLDAGYDASGLIIVEAAMAPDAGSDAHHSPLPEAPK